MIRIATFCLATALAVAPVRGQDETIDFEGLPPGTVVDAVSSDMGTGPIAVHGMSPFFGPLNVAVIFDSSDPTGNDFDLGTPNGDFDGPGEGRGGALGAPFENALPLGNVLIVAENMVDNDMDGLIDSPDDVDVIGSTLLLDFAAIGPVTVKSITLIDVEAEELPATVEFLDDMGMSIGLVILPQVDNNGVAVVDLGAVAGTEIMAVTLNGSGAIDNIVFERNIECTGSLGDFVWDDLDRDGIQDDGEPGLRDVRLTLKDAGGQTIAATATDPDGAYAFDGLCAGDYVVCVDESTLPDGYMPSPCNVGDDTLDNDCSPKPVNLPMNDSHDPTNDFGYHRPCTGLIGDLVWEDTNGDGLQDDDEPGIAGVTVFLDSAGGDVLDVTATDSLGIYLFRGLCAGDYVVRVDGGTLPPGLQPSPCNVGDDDTRDNDCSPKPVNLPTDSSEDRTCDFGYTRPLGGEGCTPGYWKQPHHFDSWPDSLSPATPFSDVFENAFPGKSLLQVLKTGGGGLKALGRHTVAALLNSSSSGVSYDLSSAQVIGSFNAVYPGTKQQYNTQKNSFAGFNEQGCPLN